MGMAAQCCRCGALLRHVRSNPLSLGLALSLASLVLFAIGATGLLATVENLGQRRTAGLLSGPAALVQNGLWELAALVFATTVAAPLMVTGASIYVLGGLRLHRPPPGLALAFTIRNRLRPWSMVEVFLVGYFVAYSKLGALAHIEIGFGLYALFGFTVASIATDALLDPQAVWEAIAQQARASPSRVADVATLRPLGPINQLVCCPVCELACAAAGPSAQSSARCSRCRAILHRRKSGSLARTAALTFSALVFYIPANTLPVLTVIQAGHGHPSTILGGIGELLQNGQWGLAAIVFTASIAVPVLKILGLGTMLAVVLQHGRVGHLRQLTALYRVIVVIGRWSMIDIFMEAILSGLVQFGTVARVYTNSGALAFAATVVLTIFAAKGFDPRLMWDASRR